MTDRPSGWEFAPLEDLLDHTIGGIWGSEPGSNDETVAVIRVTEMAPDGQLDASTAAKRSVSARQLTTRQLAVGDLVLEKSGGGPNRPVGRIGRIKHLDRPSVCSNFMQLLRPRQAAAQPSFLEYYLRHLHLSGQTIPLQTASTNIRNLKTKDYLGSAVPVPPLAEQERIVAAIDENLSRLDAAASALASARNRLLRLRASLLEQATAGNWDVRLLGEVLVSLRNGCFVSRPKVDPPGLPILRISAVRPLALDASDIRYAPEDLQRSTDYRVESGDLLFTRYSGNPDYVGACAVVPPAAAGVLHPDKLIRGVSDPDLVLGDWVALAVSSGQGRREIEQRSKTTAGQVGISGSQLKTVPIPLPPLSMQLERIAMWRAGADAIHRLRNELEAAEARASAARRSIFAAAFSGKLVPQNPDDEPASGLLEQIRAERAATPTRSIRKASAS